MCPSTNGSPFSTTLPYFPYSTPYSTHYSSPVTVPLLVPKGTVSIAEPQTQNPSTPPGKEF